MNDHVKELIADLEREAQNLSNLEMDRETLVWWDFHARRLARLRIDSHQRYYNRLLEILRITIHG